MFLSNLRIGIRLGVGFAVVLILTAVLGGVAIMELDQLSSLTTKLYKHPYAVSTAALRIDGNMVRMHRSMKDVALAKDEAGINAAAAKVAEYEKAVFKDYEIIQERFLGDKTQVEEARKLFAGWKPIRDEVIGLMRQGKRAEAAAITKGKGADYVAKLNKSIEGFIKFAQGKADGFVKSAAEARDADMRMVWILAGLAIAIGVIVAIYLTRSITRPLKDAVTVADAMAAGDLTVDIKSSSKDETGQLLSSMNSMVSKLSEMIGANVSSSQALAEGASEQAANLEETTSSLEEMASMTKQNADNAQQADSLSQDANKVIERADKSMTDMRSAMERINNASDEMAKIIKTIDEIAFQTNLLALNAAVEAARAGEAGAGFAVVADEVRSLAMRAAEAARSTSELIEDNIKNIKDGSEIVASTGEAFGEVRQSSDKVAELVAEIAAASAEQTQGIDQISRAATEMDRVTQANAANAEQMAASMAMFKVKSGAGEYSQSRRQAGGGGPKSRPSQEQSANQKLIPLEEDDFVDL
jgi:methyl-accepting chemotaxis protein